MKFVKERTEIEQNYAKQLRQASIISIIILLVFLRLPQIINRGCLLLFARLPVALSEMSVRSRDEFGTESNLSVKNTQLLCARSSLLSLFIHDGSHSAGPHLVEC